LTTSTNGRTLTYVVELKTSLSLAVLDQAIHWAGFAHWVSIAVPFSSTRRRGGSASSDLMQRWGIGYLEVDRGANVVRYHRPRLNRKPYAPERIVRACVPECSASAPVLRAGSYGGGFSTEFSRTLDRVAKAIRGMVKISGAPIPFKTVIAETEHHYSRDSVAVAQLSRWIEAGRMPGISVEITGGKRFVTLTPDA
jgi:hypothetical protein